MGGNHDDRVTSKPQPQEKEEDFLSAENLVRLGPLFLAGDNDGGGARRDRSSPPPTTPPPSHQIGEPDSCCVVEENHQPKHRDAKKNALRRSFNQRPVDPVVTVAIQMGRNGRPNLVYTLNDPLHPPSSPISLVEMKQVLKLDRQNFSTSNLNDSNNNAAATFQHGACRRLWSVSSASLSSNEDDPETTLVDLDPTNSTASTTTLLEATLVVEEGHEGCGGGGASMSEIYRAELVPEHKKMKRPWFVWIGLACVVTVVGTVLTIVLTINNNNKTGRKGDRNGHPPPEMQLVPFDRITHHVAVFRWLAPSDCTLEAASDDRSSPSFQKNNWKNNMNRPYVRIACGAINEDQQNNNYSKINNSTLVLWEQPNNSNNNDRDNNNNNNDQLLLALAHRATCIIPRDSSITNEAFCTVEEPGFVNNNSGTTAQPTPPAYVIFSCGTHASDFPTTTDDNDPLPTASILLESVQASCAGNTTTTNTSVSVVDVEQFEVGLTLGRICTGVSAGTSSSVRWTEQCGEGDAANVTAYPLSGSEGGGGVICVQDEKPAYCDDNDDANNNAECRAVPLASFRVSDDVRDAECQVDSVNGQLEELQALLARMETDLVQLFAQTVVRP